MRRQCLQKKTTFHFELLEINGNKVMPEWVNVRNPAFDVTPKKYVTGYITEEGILNKLKKIKKEEKIF